MDIVLFNTHDVVLLLTVYQCLLLVAVLLLRGRKHRLSNILLVGFLVSMAIVPLDNLISFGAAFRGWAIENLPNWFYVFETGYWLQGPFLLLFLRAKFYKKYRLRAVDFFYFAPFLLFLLHQVLAYHILPTDVKADIQRGLGAYSASFTIYFVTFAREVLRLYFGVLCALELRFYLQSLDKKMLQSHGYLVRSLKFGIYGFVAFWGWSCLIALMLVINREFATRLPVDEMGLISNYGTCILLGGILVVLGRRTYADNAWPKLELRAAITQSVPPVAGSQKSQNTGPSVNPEYIRRLDELMRDKKIYLDSAITLESLATQLSVSPRTLSTILNKHYGCNFFEFINTFRIEDAKKLLVSEQRQDATMLDIMYEVGFNSKATFNNFFKKMEGMTPREYKKINFKPLGVRS
ncbi:AraC-like DNA-binding protein [Alteromonadaceae bacterium 2753L.S.0a.02]|nr:AraC-like DNA-binding protein [Alteromonadaceae bacterium 2753L.S.0a.02]